MEGLTVRNSTGKIGWKPADPDCVNCNGCDRAAECMRRFAEHLAAYEATGLEPEAVERLKLASMGKAIAEIKEFDGVRVDRLIELAQAEKARRLLVLPCSEDELQEMLENLLSVGAADEIENYTSGYRNGYRNGRIELLKYLLQIREAAEAALAGEGGQDD